MFDRRRLTLAARELEGDRWVPHAGHCASVVLGLDRWIDWGRLRFSVGDAPVPYADELLKRASHLSDEALKRVEQLEAELTDAQRRSEEERRRREAAEADLEKLRAETEPLASRSVSALPSMAAPGATTVSTAKSRTVPIGLAIAGAAIGVAVWVAVGPASCRAPAPVAQSARQPSHAEVEGAWGPDLRHAPAAPEFVWGEAEDPKETNYPAKNPFAPESAEQAKVLSADRWIGAGDPGKPLFLRYDVNVPKAGTHTFFARKFWKHGPFRWRFDEGAWQVCGRLIQLLDSVPMRQFVGVNWVELGDVDLGAGSHTVRIELLEPGGASAFDAFALVTGGFVPHGKLKPGARAGTAPAAWFPFEPEPDPFAATPIDLRRLNEPRAGDGGFVRVQGRELVHEKSGERVRFWAVNAGHDVLGLPDAAMRRYARWLAKLGVNLVRLRGPFWQEGNLGAVDADKLDRLHGFESILKDQGIYVGLSTYFPLWLKLDQQRDGFDGYRGQHPFGLPFLSRKFRELQKGWLRQLFTAPNPRTGLPLVEDPALAYVEIINEDSTLFWTFKPRETIADPAAAELESNFGRWLAQKYGSIGQAFARWDGDPVRGDDAGSGTAGFMPLWEISQRKGVRAQDTGEFLARLMRDYHEKLSGYLREGLGYRGLIVGSNWRTADAHLLDPLDKWANSVCDVMDRHGYYSGPHRGQRAGYTVSGGDRYDDGAALRFESSDKDKAEEQSFSLPITDLVINGKPSFASEMGWTWPSRFRADLPMVGAAHGALQGIDGLMVFVSSDPDWAQALDKFTIAEPVVLGQFPAAALVFRRGLVKEAAPVVRVQVSTKELIALKGAPVAAPANFDSLRLKDVLHRLSESGERTPSTDPLAPLVGPVELDIGEAPGPSSFGGLSQLIDRRAGRIRSITGQLGWNWGRGLVTVEAPAVQAVAGFLKSVRRVELKDVAFELCNEYGAAWLVALDEKPIAESRQLLLEVVSESSNFGWSAPERGLRVIDDPGGPPLVVRNLCGRVELKRRDAPRLRVTALDAGGYPERRATRGAERIVLLPDVMYYLVEPV